MVFPSNWPSYSRSIAVLALIAVVVAGQWRGRKPNNLSEPPRLLQGSTMGTTYTIRYQPKLGGPLLADMQRLIDDELLRVNQQMSTYLKESEISRFNDLKSTDWFPVSAETAKVVDLSLQISTISNGAFDVTVGRLVNLWGFGPDKTRKTIPPDAEIVAAKAAMGFKNLSVKFDPPALRKSNPELQVDLSAIAKGHGVDRVAALFLTHGISNYFVEIGGEIFASGTRPDGQPWQVGIEAPIAYKQSIQTVIGLSGAAMATSGDYRNFFEVDNQRFSHTIDPNTGRPVTHQLASASVVAENCALADAIATCMMVLGPEQGLELAEAENWAVLLMQRENGQISSTCSNAFSDSFPVVCKQLALANSLK
jgi:thiamine biosynthesis lipoprotein